MRLSGGLPYLTKVLCVPLCLLGCIKNSHTKLWRQCLPGSVCQAVLHLMCHWVQVSQDCSNFDEAEAWPLLLDNYAEWVQKKQGNGGSQTVL